MAPRVARHQGRGLPALAAALLAGCYTLRRSDVGTAFAAPRSVPRAQRRGVRCCYKVTLSTPDGEKSFECDEGENILDKAQSEGLNLPYSCRAGACSSCTGKIVSGSVDQSAQAYLDGDQVAAGYCLTCVSSPTSDVTIETHQEEASEVYVPMEVSVAQADIHQGGADSMGVKFRQNFAETPETLLNAQVRMELSASHAYLAMAAYFDRADVALPGFKEWAQGQSAEEREHAEKFIEYINLRGGDYIPTGIDEPAAYSWSSALTAMESALKMEMQVNKALLRLHKAASDAGDAQLCDFLEANYLTEQVESINEISKVVRQLMRAGPGLGEYTVDKEMAEAAGAGAA